MNTNDVKLKNAILDPNCIFFIKATQSLKEKICKSSDPVIEKLPKEVKLALLDDNGYVVENSMISRFVDGSLDDDNKHLLSLCDIRVLQDKIKIL